MWIDRMIKIVPVKSEDRLTSGERGQEMYLREGDIKDED